MTQTRVCDAHDRLTSVQMPDGTTAAYQYDHAGRRIQETLNSTQTTNFLWDELSPYGDVIAEYAGNQPAIP